jgi:hypothetical protein
MEKRVLKRIFNREEVVGGWRRVHNEEFRNFCDSSNITSVIKSRRMRLGWEDGDWIHLAQDKDQWCVLLNIVMNIRVP